MRTSGCVQVGVEAGGARQAEPRVQLVDVAVRVDAASALLTRVPPKSDVSPASPVRV